jgi:phospholipid/cholesterol/gamma-HCH transport system substrate-binding protein
MAHTPHIKTVPPGRMVAVAAVAVLAATGAASGLAASQDSGRVIMAEFTDVSPILAGQQVKVHGVTVGQVGAPSYLPDRKIALVPLHVEAAALPVHTDATAFVAPISLLGERFIDLDTGSADAPVLPVTSAITTRHTGQKQDLQAILDTTDDPTAASLAAMVTTLGQGAEGNGENIRKTLAALAPAMNDTDRLVSVLAEQNELLGGVVDQVTPVTQALAADDGRRLDGLVDSATSLLATTAQRDAQLRSTLEELPSTLASARRTLGDLTGTANAATATLHDIRPLTDNLVAVSDELTTFSNSADPALASADPVLDRASELLDAAQPVAEQLRAAGPDLRTTAAGAAPIVENLRGNLGNVLGFIRNWALTTNQKDGLSHYFRASYVLNPDAVSGNLPGGLPDLAPSPPFNPNPNPKVDRAPGGPIPDVGGLLAPQPGTPDNAAQPDAGGSATGLSPDQEQGALGFLMGGGR